MGENFTGRRLGPALGDNGRCMDWGGTSERKKYENPDRQAFRENGEKKLIVNKRLIVTEMKLNSKGNMACSIHIFTANTLCDSQLLFKVLAI